MRLRFDCCEIDLDRFVLKRDGETVHVEPQVFDLIALLARDGSVVSKDQLVDVVWRGLAVSDATIAARISAARAALGDDGKSQRIIRTIPRRGIQLCVPVETVDAPVGKDAARVEQVAHGHAAGPPPVRFASSADGTSIAWSVSGDGPPLVRIGHWLSHLELDWHSPVWRPLIDRLEQRHRLIRYDLRGTGLSSRDAPLEGLEPFVDDLACVIKASGQSRVALFASSQAGPVAVAFAARWPEMVSKLVILGGYAEGRVFREDDGASVDEPTVLAMIRAGWGQRGSAFIKAFSTLFMPDATPEQVESLVEMQLATADPETAVKLRRVIDRFRVTDLLGRVGASTLVMHAAQDGIHPVSQGKAVAAGIPDAQFVELNSRNHMLVPQDPEWERVMTLTERFLGV